MRAYTFAHFMLSTIAKGIQHSHSITELFVKYERIDIYDYAMTTGREIPDHLLTSSIKASMLYDWAQNHKTMILLTAGNSPQLDELETFFNVVENPYPWAGFNEDESLEGIMTSVSIILPEKIYGTVSAMKTGVLSFEPSGYLHCVDTSKLDPEMITALMSYGSFSPWEQDLVNRLGDYRLAS